MSAVTKQEVEGKLILQRRLKDKLQELVLTRDRCVGCGYCADICPKEAIIYHAAVFEGIKRVSPRPWIDINPELCIMCGNCAYVCPVRAFRFTTDGEEKLPPASATLAAIVKSRER